MLGPSWIRPDGREMEEANWNDPNTRSIAILLCGDDMDAKTSEGHKIQDDTFCLCFNAHFDTVDFLMPGTSRIRWSLVLDTAQETGFPDSRRLVASKRLIHIEARSMQLYKQIVGSDAQIKSTIRRTT